MTPLRRHSLAWPVDSPTAERGPSAQRSIDIWHARGNPFVVGQDRHQHDGVVSLGLCVPRVDPESPSGRVGSYGPIDGLARTAQPPRIGEVLVAAERYDLPGYRSVALVAERAADADFEVRVFGSWLWFWLSGEGNETFVTAESDLDLVIDVAGECEAVAACRLLGSCQQELDGRGDGAIVIDAELAIAGIGDMHWRELVGSSDAVLVKSVAGPQMIPRDQLWR